MNNRQWGAESLFVRLRCIPLMVIVMVIMGICAYPSMADDNAYDIPKGATQAWIDVESSKASEVGVQGSFNDVSVTFKPSPSGVTAVVDVSAIQGKQSALQLQSNSDIKARVAVTFADGNDKIVAQCTSNTVIAKVPATVNPGRQEKLVSDQIGESANDMVHTGVSVLVLAVVAVLIALVGLVLTMLHRNKMKLTADGEDAQ